MSEKKIETYLGIGSFQDTPVDQALFHGRKRDAELLADLVLSDTLTVLCSRSGLGKTSLINAGLLHRMRSRNYFPAVARLVNPVDKPIESILGYIRKQADDASVTITGGEGETTLWGFLYHARFTRNGTPVKLLLVLDQFEELFTRVREHDREHGASTEEHLIRDLSDVVRRRLPDAVRERAASELEAIDAATIKRAEIEGREADLVEDCVDSERRQKLVQLLYEPSFPDVKVLLSLREDYLADLDRMRRWVPSIFRNMLRLEPLSIKAAEEAIVEPARVQLPGKDTFTYEPEAVKRILDFLRKRTIEIEKRVIVENTIDPWQLQILCQSLDRKRQQKTKETDQIMVADVGDEKAMRRILTGFYLDILKKLPQFALGPNRRRFRVGRGNAVLFHSPKVAARVLVETGLITRGGKRNSLTTPIVSDEYGIGKTELDRIKEEKLVRSTFRDDVEHIELTHDSLIRSIYEYKRDRRWRSGTALLVIYGFVSLAAAVGAYVEKEQVRNQRFEEVRSELLELERAAETREMRALDKKSREFLKAIKDGKRDFSDADLTRITISPSGRTGIAGIKFVDANLSRSVLDNAQLSSCDFTDANLEHASLRTATVIATTLTDANVRNADLSGSRIYLSQMDRLDARGANFTDAVLFECDLNKADLRGAKFRDSVLTLTVMRDTEIDAMTTFEGTAWWLASGWSETQRKQLLKAFPTAAIVDSGRYKADVLERETEIAKQPAGAERADLLNDLAWYYAIRNVELEKALKLAREADRLSPDTASFKDTAGFILFLLGRPEEARVELERAVALGDDSGEITYHLAQACGALGDTANERTYRKQSQDREYVPTYELVLRPRKRAPPPVAPVEVALPPITTTAELYDRLITLEAEIEHGTPSWGVSYGNFDGNGIAFGVIGFTLRSGQLQRLLKDMRERNPARFDEIMGAGRDDMIKLIEAPTTEAAMKIGTSRVFQAPQLTLLFDRNLREEWTERFRNLGDERQFKEIQLQRIEAAYLGPARASAAKYGLKSRRGLAFMLDVHIQSGGIRAAIAPKIDEAMRKAQEANPDFGEPARMVLIANILADNSSERFREAVRARKLAIANGGGEIYGRKFDLGLRGITLEDIP